MIKYLLADSAAWLDTCLYSNLISARHAALNLMDRPAWETTTTMRILRIDTKKEVIEDVEHVIHGVYRAEAHKVEDK